ncbi:heterokaryon incompatibility protein-domain-containing protein [Fusarium solani]|uniref:Heterokaryon incompatibility protein-domain-containing protein n=1 Tax=Fusarium solani TaxID=169388 RepID=A0A9P9H1Q8_FUSSL|nr:heterokaryon incompatibility protein-domain-containing protein [Fusarium solani]KAH7249544.1 heterokaryon incompatibility protein-domain-containing protein [Fusarium solani]
MDPKIYAIRKRLREQTRQLFEPMSSRPNNGPKGITIPLIRPPENCENRKRHVIDYNPLPTSTSIRVLQVHSERFENEFDFYTPPRCSLVVKDLDDDPVYDALSYTWSCPVTIYSNVSEASSAAAWAAPSFDIICDGKPFSVTANLYAAILSLRLRASKTGHRYCRTLARIESSNMTKIVSPTLYIWIDQICINQSDLKERNSQVMLMGRIYKQSRLCLVWLGGDDQFSQSAVDTMTKLLNTEDELFSKLAALNIFQTKNYGDIGMEPIEPWEWIALYAFLSRSWFWRSWVVQEAALSKQLSFCCGITAFTLDHLSYLMDLLMEAKCLSSMTGLAQALQGQSNSFTEQARIMKARDPGARLYQPNPDDRPNQSMLKHLSGMRTKVFGFNSSISSPEKTWKPDRHGLSHVLGPFKSMRATDPRDKVYAFLGLAEELGQGGTLHPAYEKPIAEVFRDAMQFMLRSSNSLNDLALKEDPQRTKTAGLESWVPDFTSDSLASPRVHPVLSMWSKGKNPSTTDFTFHPGGVLEVRGLRIGTARAVHELTGLLGPGVDNGPNSLMSLLQSLPEDSSVWIPPLTPSLRSYLETSGLVPNEEIYGHVPIQDGGAVVIQSRLEVFWRTLLTNRFGKEFPPSRSTVGLLLRFWDRELHLRVIIAGLFSDPAASSGQTNGMFSQFGGDSPNWDMLKSSISAMYRAQKILKGQLSDDVQNDLFPKEMSAILPELDAAWAEGRRSDEGMAMAQVAMKQLSRPFSAEALGFQREVEINCSGKHLFATKEGQLGIGPKSTREGDEVWNLVGGDAPFVLRPQGGGRYALLGGASVHGAMFAEWHEGDFDAIAKDIKTVLLV